MVKCKMVKCKKSFQWRADYYALSENILNKGGEE